MLKKALLNFALDSNTEDFEETTHHINLIFTSENGLPDPDHSLYRLESFDELNLSDFTKLMSRAEGEEIFSNHAYNGACFVKERNYEFYKGEYKVFLSQHWMALPSLSIRSQSYILYVMSLVCCISANNIPAPVA